MISPENMKKLDVIASYAGWRRFAVHNNGKDGIFRKWRDPNGKGYDFLPFGESIDSLFPIWFKLGVLPSFSKEKDGTYLCKLHTQKNKEVLISSEKGIDVVEAAAMATVAAIKINQKYLLNKAA